MNIISSNHLKAQVKKLLPESFLQKSLIWINPKLTDWDTANLNGWKLKSQWKKEGFTVSEDQEIKGVIFNKFVNQYEADMQGQSWEVCLAKSGKFSYWSEDCYKLYAHPEEAGLKQAQEEGKKSAAKAGNLEEKTASNKDNSTVPPVTEITPSFSLSNTPSLSSYMWKEYTESKDNKGLTANRSNSAKSKVNNLKAYVPEGLDLPENHPFRDEIFYVCGLIYWRQLDQRLSRETYIQLSKEALKDQIGQEAWAYIVKNQLGEDKIFERDNWYCKGAKCYGYRLSLRYRGQTHRLKPLTRPTLVRKLAKIEINLKTATEKALKENLFRLTIDPICLRDNETDPNIEYLQSTVQAIQDRQFYLRPDSFARRLHSNLTNMRKDLRKYLRLDSVEDTLRELDIPNSQPLFLAVAASQKGLCEPDFVKLTETGQLYSHVARRIGLTRDAAKLDTLKYFYEEVNPTGLSARAVKLLFERDFPLVAQFIAQAKVKDTNRLCRILQKAEREFIIERCCRRLVKSSVWCATIHDAIYCSALQAEEVLKVVKEEFAKLGVNPDLAIGDTAEY